MEHTRALQHLGDYVQGRLDADDETGMNDHLKVCEECAELVSMYRLFSESRTAEAEDGAGEHPPADAIVSWAIGRGGLSAEVAANVEAHVGSCVSCGEDVETTRAAHDATRQWNLESVRFGGTPSRVRRWGLAAAAVATILLALIFATPPRPLLPTAGSEYRGLADAQLTSLVPPDATLPRGECVLRWSAPEGARFDVLVASENLRVVERATGLVATQYRIPVERLAELPSGTRLVWQLEARMTDGSRLRPLTSTVIIE